MICDKWLHIYGNKLGTGVKCEWVDNVQENIKGHWIKRIDHLDYGLIEFEGFECSLCGVKIWKDDYENVKFKFCPNCGADMRGEQCE